MDLSQRTLQHQIIERPAVTPDTSNDPTAIRYGWCAFKDIPLLDMGQPCPYVQAREIAGPDGRPILNPFFEKLPKGQLIPFPTFDIIEQQQSQDAKLPDGRPALELRVRQRPALECVVMVSRTYGEWGFTVFQSLQGIDQPTAQRIFGVVQPFNYLISEIQSELAFADERIEASEPLTFPDVPGYVVDCLHSDAERSIAYRLRDEMTVGADIAYLKATGTLDDTEMSMKTRMSSSGVGKTGPDLLDKYLCKELNRELPKIVGEVKPIAPDLSNLEQKIDYVFDRERTRELQEEADSLRRELQELRDRLKTEAEESKTAPADIYYCDAAKADGSPCRNTVKAPGEKCFGHRNKETAANVA